MASRALDSLGAVIDELTSQDYGLYGLVSTAAECLYWMAEDSDLADSTRVAMVYLGSNLRDAAKTMERIAGFLQAGHPGYRRIVAEGADLGGMA